MVVTLPLLGAIAAILVWGAATNWAAIATGSDPAPGLVETIALSAFGAVLSAMFLVTLIVGIIRVREQRTAERATAQAAGAGAGAPSA